MKVEKIWKTSKGYFITKAEASKKRNLSKIGDRFGPMGFEKPTEVTVLSWLDSEGNNQFSLLQPLKVSNG